MYTAHPLGRFCNARWGLLKIGQSLIGSSDWYQENWENLGVLSNKEWLILWGTKDKFITVDYLQKWQNKLANHQTVLFDCGHFVQEEKTKKSLEEIIRFIRN